MIVISGTLKTQLEISDRGLAEALFQKIQEFVGAIDDCGCDWYTSGNKVYICDESWLVCDDERVAALVDAANVLLLGRKLTLTETGNGNARQGMEQLQAR